MSSSQKRREVLRIKVIPQLPDSLRYSETLAAPMKELIAAVREHGFEGIVAKRRDSPYEPASARERGKRCASFSEAIL